MKHKLSLLTLLILIAGFTLNGQVTGIKGKVFDVITREPIPFANVVVEDSSSKYIAGAITDTAGNYLFQHLQAGNYTVKASFIGYASSITKGVSVKKGLLSTLDISLEATAVAVEGVTITKYRVPLIDKDKTVSGATVTSEEIAKPSAKKKASESTVRKGGDVTARIEDKEMNSDLDITESGQLTASELNDFSKWDLWQDIKSNDLKEFQSIWKISPELRYSVQVRANDGQPVADAVVLLKSAGGKVIWSAKTDNTGKAELWSNLFQETKQGTVALSVLYDDKEYPYKNPNLISKGINTLKIPVSCNNPNNVDIAFVVDATGSMVDEMSYLKAELLDIVNSQPANSTNLTFNVGSVFYRDFGDVYVTRKSDFSTDIIQTLDFIKLQNAESGGDFPEAVDEGLMEAVAKLEWSKNARARILFLLLDAPPHATSEVKEKLQRTIQLAAQKGIRIVPVVASSAGDAGSLEYLMRSIALATNGTYVFLTDHSNIGLTHAKPVTDQYDVELLNNLLKRLIVQYTYMPECAENPLGKATTDTSYFINSPIVAHEILDLTRTRAPYKPKELLQDFTKQAVADSTEIPTVADSISVTPAEEPVNPGEPDVPLEIKYYPNPTSGTVTVELQGAIKELYLTDISGKLIKTYKVSGDTQLKVDLSEYSTGIYFLKCFAQNKSFTGKIMLTR